MAHEYDGFSFFGEWKLEPNWRLVGGFDDFNRTPEDMDLSFTRFHGGIGYDFGGAISFSSTWTGGTGMIPTWRPTPGPRW